MTLTTDKEARKAAPLARGVLDYFSGALMGVAQCSVAGNLQHNGGLEDIHWARDKSSDHADCILRHLVDRDEVDTDGIPHVYKVAWRALALAQEYAEKHGASPSKASRWTAKDDVFAGVEEEAKSAADNIALKPFLAGERVRIVKSDNPCLLGRTGTVEDFNVYSWGHTILVRPDEDLAGYYGHGIWMDLESVEFVPDGE